VRRLFTYTADDEIASSLERGVRVRVPFGGRRVVGTVVEWPAPPPDEEVELKAIDSVIAGERRLSPDLLDLTRFVADYYLCSWGEAIEAALPPESGAKPVRRLLRLTAAADPTTLPGRAPARRRLLEKLRGQGGGIPLTGLSRSERRLVAPLRELGQVEVVEQPTPPREPREARHEAADPPRRPTPAQAAALGRLEPAIAAGGYQPFLLFGATGSGKTEVYLQAAQRMLDRGRGVLYLVPEIGLTPLLLTTIRRRFPGRAVVLHSALARRERNEAWESVRSGRRRFVVGTRSAVFAPLEDPGLIIVDEEQDGSYKQSDAPRYNGRDIAIVRARHSGSVIVLGSATPSMESFRHARAGRYELLRLGGRIEERPLPEVRVVDMREEYMHAGEVSALSRALTEELRACLERGEQALILRNRRGWAAALHCPTCGERVQCTRCSIAMTWHRSARRLRCHYCSFEQGYPDGCPHCGAGELNQLGEGTERIEDVLRRALPGAAIERMDRDTIRRRGAHERMLRRFESGEIDVLVGTQMIAKGHDFPRVTLVGVLSADQALGLPDFRSAERAFQLLTQVAGRAGRGERPGVVVVQAFDAEHPVLRLAATQDYEAFYDREIPYRRALRYPPLSALVRILIQDKDPVQARKWAAIMADSLREAEPRRLLLAGPGPAPIERLKGRYREQILVRAAGRRRLVQTVDRALSAVEGKIPRRGLTVDVDPLSLL
jgi:primosomal protein N' (replication factor Y)